MEERKGSMQAPTAPGEYGHFNDGGLMHAAGSSLFGNGSNGGNGSGIGNI